MITSFYNLLKGSPLCWFLLTIIMVIQAAGIDLFAFQITLNNNWLGIPWITHLFIHENFNHYTNNIIFFLIFSWLFTIFYKNDFKKFWLIFILSGIIGAFAQIFISSFFFLDMSIGMVGSSAAICGILGGGLAYLSWSRIDSISIGSALFAICIFLFELFNGIFQIMIILEIGLENMSSLVGHFCHAFGLLTGYVIGIFIQNKDFKL